MVLSTGFDIKLSVPPCHKKDKATPGASWLSTDLSPLSTPVLRVLLREHLLTQSCFLYDKSVSHRHLHPVSFLDSLSYFLQLLHQSSLYHPELECCGGGLTPKHSITLFWKLLTWLCSLTHCVTLYLKAVEVAAFKSHSTISPVSLSFPSSLPLSIFLDKKWATLLIVILSKRWYGSFYLSTWEDIFPD